METSDYSKYKKVCIKILENYTNCISSNNNSNKFSEIYNADLHDPSVVKNVHKCYEHLYLLEKWCMNPVGNIPKKW
jgi:hypothetical protein